MVNIIITIPLISALHAQITCADKQMCIHVHKIPFSTCKGTAINEDEAPNCMCILSSFGLHNVQKGQLVVVRLQPITNYDDHHHVCGHAKYTKLIQHFELLTIHSTTHIHYKHLYS